uniref:Uncharacterized protein n=1 Tax=Acrobeloides nanus TaxID=290746 RepID=A0A914C1C9_9BILA
MNFSFSTLVFVSIIAFCYAKTYKVAVEGEVVCAGKPVRDAEVTIWERDTLRRDDKGQTKKTDRRGEFELQLEESALLGSIEPYLIIKHNCNTKRENCIRESTFNFPKEFIFKKDERGRPWVKKFELTPEAKDGDKKVCK